MPLENLLAQHPAPWSAEAAPHISRCGIESCEFYLVMDGNGRPMGSHLQRWLAEFIAHLPDLVAALQFYAEPKHYFEHAPGNGYRGHWAGADYVDPDFDYDDGECARAALKLLESGTGRRVVP